LVDELMIVYEYDDGAEEVELINGAIRVREQLPRTGRYFPLDGGDVSNEWKSRWLYN
jgi:hypothetical protein